MLAGAKPHVDIMRGTPKQAWDYCSKPDTRVLGPFIYGKCPSQGRRTDLISFNEDLKEKIKTSSDVSVHLETLRWDHMAVEAHHMRYFDRKLQEAIPARTHLTEGVVFTGPPGTGKSYRAMRWLQDRGITRIYHLRLPNRAANGTLWFDHYYLKPEAVIINEMAPHRLLVEDFNMMLDEQPWAPQTKGGDVQFVARYVVFTSNHELGNWFVAAKDTPVDLRSVFGRIQYWYSLDYHADHIPDPTCSNRVDTARHAVVTVQKEPANSL